MSAAPITVELVADDDSLVEMKRGFDCLALLLADRPDAAGKVRDDFLCGDELRPDLISIEAGSAMRAGRLSVRFELTDRFRELVMALVTGESDREVVEVI